MLAVQLIKKKTISYIEFEDNSSKPIKVRITKALLNKIDIAEFNGTNFSNFPIIPCGTAIGQIVECPEDSFFQVGNKVLLKSEYSCGKCDNCISKDDECISPIMVGTDIDGYLREFINVDEDDIVLLPNQIEDDALYINLISKSISIIDELKIEKGDNICIIGESFMSVILSQLISYYQAVPCTISCSKEFNKIISQCGVYYNININNNYQNNIKNITSGKLFNKVIYITESDIDAKIIEEVSSNKAQVIITGINTDTKICLSNYIAKQLKLNFVSLCNRNYESSINLLMQKALKFNILKVPEYSFYKLSEKFSKITDNNMFSEFIINFIPIK